MIVLRKRINDMEMAERNYEPPAEWTEWEKGYYTSYGAHVCEFAGLLQALLLSTRPGLGLGMLGLVVLSVPIAAVTAVCHLIEISQLILSKVQ
ncbi:hypothetical protein ACMD2_12973 [Ananas comosus]|nr:hypothetical protein ACMD2_12973 [Ananas comosus]